jgi:shikimate dehydrogenase
MIKLGLLGHPVGHSKSPEFFAEKLESIGRTDVEYVAIDLADIDDFDEVIREHAGVMGFNVTIPHKESIMGKLCCLDEEAEKVGAVNTIVKTERGWKGYNTDVWGFSRSLKPFIKGRHERALILGSGGAAKAVEYCLGRLGIETVLVSRTAGEGKVVYENLTEAAMGHYLLVVNCTPLGTWPEVEGCVDIPWRGVGEMHLCVDLVYNPEETTFMKRAKEKGATVMNGSDMLRMQAERSLEIWLENGL